MEIYIVYAEYYSGEHLTKKPVLFTTRALAEAWIEQEQLIYGVRFHSLIGMEILRDHI